VPMTEAVASKSFWDLPIVSMGDDGVVYIDFRDCLVDIENGIVRSYFDKIQSVLLRPSGELDSWHVYLSNGKNTGQAWHGIIAFDGTQLLIQQAHNALFRVYKTNGIIETQLRRSRLIERPGFRSIVFQHGQLLDEDIEAGTRTIAWADQTTVRDSEGRAVFYDSDGNVIEPNDKDHALVAVENEALSAFEQYLLPWEKFSAVSTNGEFVYGGPPGLCETAPGEYFSTPIEGKPLDFRESISHDFGDGTMFYEYVGRLGTPFVAHEVVTYKGAVLARCVEYDQPKSIQFCDSRGVIRHFSDVLKVEIQFEPSRAEYITSISDANSKEYIHPKGAQFLRAD